MPAAARPPISHWPEFQLSCRNVEGLPSCSLSSDSPSTIANYSKRDARKVADMAPARKPPADKRLRCHCGELAAIRLHVGEVRVPTLLRYAPVGCGRAVQKREAALDWQRSRDRQRLGYVTPVIEGSTFRRNR